MKTTASLLTLAIGFALAGATPSVAAQDAPRDQDTTPQALDDQQAPSTDPLDTVDEPLDTVTHPMEPVPDPLTAQTSDSSTMDQADSTAGQLDPVDDMDEPAYDATAATGTTATAGGPPAAELGAFASYDGNGDGYVERSELKGDNALLGDAFVRFDSNDDQRLDRYEFDSLSSGQFASLDANADHFLDETEASTFASLGASFTSVDVDGDGRISEVEHRAFLDSDAWASDRDRYAFRYLDLDGDGFVSRTEAAQFTDFAAEFDSLDEDADGLVENTQYDLFLREWDQDAMAWETEDQ